MLIGLLNSFWKSLNFFFIQLTTFDSFQKLLNHLIHLFFRNLICRLFQFSGFAFQARRLSRSTHLRSLGIRSAVWWAIRFRIHVVQLDASLLDLLELALLRLSVFLFRRSGEVHGFESLVGLEVYYVSKVWFLMFLSWRGWSAARFSSWRVTVWGTIWRSVEIFIITSRQLLLCTIKLLLINISTIISHWLSASSTTRSPTRFIRLRFLIIRSRKLKICRYFIKHQVVSNNLLWFHLSYMKPVTRSYLFKFTYKFNVFLLILYWPSALLCWCV